MIHQMESTELGVGSSYTSTAGFTPLPAVASVNSFMSVEEEIAKLTWSVLDGSASLTDRQRLAALVDAQHARRRPLNR